MYRLSYLFFFCFLIALSACKGDHAVQKTAEPDEKVEDVGAIVPEAAPPAKSEPEELEDSAPVAAQDKGTGTGKVNSKPATTTTPTYSTRVDKPAPTAPLSVKPKKDDGSKLDQKTQGQKTEVSGYVGETSPEGDKSSLEKIASSARGIDLDKTPSLNKPDHGLWNTQLSRFVSSQGQVDYADWKRSEANLDKYLEELSNNPIQDDWSRQEKMAYWINAYNAFTVKLILKNYPVQKITDLHAGKPWDVKWIKLDDKTYSLNQIEHDILRPKFGDARIHFAVNCAAVSCPPLMNKAYTAANLNSSLAANTRSFINNSRYNTINSSAAEVSKIFDWYKADFGDLTAYLNKYADTKLEADADITFKDYNWSLNGK